MNMLKEKFMKIIVPLIAVVALILAGYFYSQIRVLMNNPQAMAQKEIIDLVAKVSKLVVLPVGETPTIATVSDPETLKDQAFFVFCRCFTGRYRWSYCFLISNTKWSYFNNLIQDYTVKNSFFGLSINQYFVSFLCLRKKCLILESLRV